MEGDDSLLHQLRRLSSARRPNKRMGVATIDIINVKNLAKDYQTYERGSTFAETFKSLFHRKKLFVKAVKSLSFTVPKGQIVGLLGPNGAGKSTLIKMLTGVMLPTSGEADVLGFTPWKQRSKYVQHIGVVFGQKSQLIWDIPPQDSFHMNKAIYNVANNDFKRILSSLVELFGVGDIIKKPTRQLSLGERMKCEFIMALLHGPEIVFLDEPTIGLDILAKTKIHEVIKEMNTLGVTFILTTHDLEDVEKLAQRVIVINRGEIVFDNDMTALRNHLGQKKRVRILSTEPLPALEMPGVRTVESSTALEAFLELDNDIISTHSFVSFLGTIGSIADISIQEPPIEEVVKVLYEIGTETK
jgi:ABC-2 type transport system ATP-binding protein